MAVLQTNIYSNSLRGQTGVTIIVPAEKVELPGVPPRDFGKPFKTLYLLHGFSASHLDWLYNSGIVNLALMNNLAIVCPNGGNSFYIDDLTLGAFYERWICIELPELLARLLPISGKREDTFIGGLSMGGYGALRLGLKHADKYAAVIALSSALISNEVSRMKEGEGNFMDPYEYYRHVFGEPSAVIGSDKDLQSLAAKLKDGGCTIPEIYMACGTEDFLIENNREFDAFLTNIGVAHSYAEGHGVHDWRFWNEHIGLAVGWLKGKGLV